MKTRILSFAVAFAFLGCATFPQQPAAERIQTIVVIYAENHSFDNMYGMFPGANGVAQRDRRAARSSATTTASVLPHAAAGVQGRQARSRLSRRAAQRPVPHRRAADQQAHRPAHARARSTSTTRTSSRSTAGKNDKFVAMTNVGGWVMGYYDGSSQLRVAVGEAIHARRQLLHGRLRRLVPQPPVARLRVHARVDATRRPRCARRLDEQRAPEAQARLAGVRDGTARRSSTTGRSRPTATR